MGSPKMTTEEEMIRLNELEMIVSEGKFLELRAMDLVWLMGLAKDALLYKQDLDELRKQYL